MNFPAQHDELTTLQYLIANYFPTKDAAQAQAVLSRLVTAAAIEAQGLPEVLRNALQQISDWNSHSLQLAVEYGAVGVRDFYRQIALDALASAPPAPQAKPQASVVQQEPVASAMTAHRAAYFIERFKHEEKLLGPNEQAALDFVLSMLYTYPAQQAKPQPLSDKQLKQLLAAEYNRGWDDCEAAHDGP